MGLESKIWSPCFFGLTLQQGVQLIAALNMAFGVWFVVLITLYYILISEALSGGGEVSALITGIWIFLGVLMLLDVVVHFGFLFRGASERSAKKIKIFLIVTLVMIGIRLISLLVMVFSFSTIFIFILAEIPNAYQLWVVFCFHKEISNVDQYNGQPGGGGGDQYGEP